VAGLVRAALPHAPLVVLSAMGRTTDALLGMAASAERGELPAALAALHALMTSHRAAATELLAGSGCESPPADVERELARHAEGLEHRLRGVTLLGELSPRTRDAIAGHGEQLSTLLLARRLQADGVPTTLLDGRRVMRTDARFGAAAPRPREIARLAGELLAPQLGPGRAVVTQGFVGSTEDGVPTTLGRGGSDLSAALLGAALGADEIQIWTDVEGVLTADPRVVPEAAPIGELSFAEAAELAAFGAKVLHPATIQPAVAADIPVTVRHTQRPAGRFTTIRAEVATGRAVTALASRGPITVLTVTSTRMLAQAGFLARLFDVFGRHGVSVDLVATAEVSVSLTVEGETPLEALGEELSAFASVEVATGRAIVAVVGERLKQTDGLAARIFAALGDINVEMISMGANEINLSLVVRHADMDTAVRRLHAALVATARAPSVAGSAGTSAAVVGVHAPGAGVSSSGQVIEGAAGGGPGPLAAREHREGV
jgi:aspartate kinase